MMNMTSGERAMPADRAFFVVAALIFAASATATVTWCASMAVMGGMEMPGGWTMSMMWMPMPDATWHEAAVSFLAMWTVMMMAMMLPSLLPMLQRYREAVGSGAERHLGRLTVLAGAGYFALWVVLGLAVFALGMALAEMTMRQEALARAVPIAAGVIVLLAGAAQFTGWKAHNLACCRNEPGRRAITADGAVALRHGLRLGLRCASCCANLMAILLVLGVMDLIVMVAVTAAITFERLAPNGERAAQAVGVITLGAGLLLIARAAGLA